MGKKPGLWQTFTAYRAAEPNAETDDPFDYALRRWAQRTKASITIRAAFLALGTAAVLWGVDGVSSALDFLRPLGIGLVVAVAWEVLHFLAYWLRAPTMQRDTLRREVATLRETVAGFNRPLTAYARDKSSVNDMKAVMEAIGHLLDHPQTSGPAASKWSWRGGELRDKVDMFSRDGRLTPLAQTLIKVPKNGKPRRRVPNGVAGVGGLEGEWEALEQCERGLAEAIAAQEEHFRQVEAPS